MSRRVDWASMAGGRYGSYTVIRFVGLDAKSRAQVECRCDCGRQTVLDASSLLRTNTGRRCQRCASSRHGHTSTAGISPTYESWKSMKRRCRPSGKYGRLGIRVCARWARSFEAFLEDMGPRPPGHTIDRIDNSRGYEPGNCRWATAREQALNSRSARWFLTVGSTTKPLTVWAEELGVSPRTVRDRLRRGLSHAKALGIADGC